MFLVLNGKKKGKLKNKTTALPPPHTQENQLYVIYFLIGLRCLGGF